MIGRRAGGLGRGTGRLKGLGRVGPAGAGVGGSCPRSADRRRAKTRWSSAAGRRLSTCHAAGDERSLSGRLGVPAGPRVGCEEVDGDDRDDGEKGGEHVQARKASVRAWCSLSRQDRPLMLMTIARCNRRSKMAAATTGSPPNSSAQVVSDRLVVTIVELPRS